MKLTRLAPAARLVALLALCSALLAGCAPATQATPTTALATSALAAPTATTVPSVTSTATRTPQGDRARIAILHLVPGQGDVHATSVLVRTVVYTAVPQGHAGVRAVELPPAGHRRCECSCGPPSTRKTSSPQRTQRSTRNL